MTRSETRQTILVVDDVPTNIKILQATLKADYRILFATRGDKALAMAEAQCPPDLILLDVVMPEMDGYEVCRRLKANPATRDIPVVFLTAQSEVEDETKGLELGAIDYITKPFSPAIVQARVRTQLALQNRTRELKKTLEDLDLRNRFIRKTFGRYLSDELVQQILEDPEGAALGGEKREITIMMADLRGFTAISERLPAEDVVGIINVFLEEMTEVILKYQGTIVEFLGDAIFAIFGAPIVRSDDPQRAVACAIEMQLAMDRVNRRNADRGYPQVAMGIGINTDPLIVGNIGSMKRVKFGAVGYGVNLAARIESYSLGGQILISETTRAACGDLLRIDDRLDVLPKGVRSPITIFEIGGIGDPFDVALPPKTEQFLADLTKPLAIKFSILGDKHGGDATLSGWIARLSADSAEIECDLAVDRLTNLKMSLFDAQGREVTSNLYAKVSRAISDSPPRFQAYFTFVPTHVKTFIERTQQAHEHKT